MTPREQIIVYVLERSSEEPSARRAVLIRAVAELAQGGHRRELLKLASELADLDHDQRELALVFQHRR